MENMRKELDNLKAKFRKLEDKKKVLYRDFADFLLDDERSGTLAEIEELRDGINRVKTVNDEKKNLENQIEVIKRQLEEKQNLEDERKTTRGSIRDLEKANMSLYENMGRAGYQAFREGLLNDNSFGSVFLTLEEEKEKIDTYEVELNKNSPVQGNFFKKMMNRSRAVYLKSNQNLRIRNLVKIYQKAGEALGYMDGIPWQENEPLKHAFLPFYKNKEKLDELSVKDDNLADKENDLRDRMESMGIQRNSGKRLQELSDDIDYQDEKINQEKIVLGSSFWEIDKKRQKTIEISSGLKKRKLEIEGEEEQLLKSQDILERKIRRNELSEKLKLQERDSQRLNDRIEQLKSDLDRKKAEIGDTNKELENIAKELESLGEELG